MKKQFLHIALVVFALPLLNVLQLQSAAASGGAESAQSSHVDFDALFNRWNNALQTGNPQVVAALYDVEGVLLPTVSNKVKVGRDEIAKYFEHFLTLKPQGTILERFTRAIGDNAGVDSGIYEFALTKDGKVDHVKARYTYLYKKVNGVWVIAVHHSSVLPNAEEVVKPEIQNEYDI